MKIMWRLKPVVKSVGAIFAVALVSLLVPGQAKADSSLDGQTITTTYLFPDTSTVFAAPVDTVVPGGLIFFAGFADVTFSANNILITADRDAAINNVAFDGFEFFDSIGIFTSVTLNPSTTYAGFNASRVTFNANEILVNVADLPGLNGQTISLDINKSVMPTPEPSSLMLLGAGLLGFVGFSLKKIIA